MYANAGNSLDVSKSVSVFNYHNEMFMVSCVRPKILVPFESRQMQVERVTVTGVLAYLVQKYQRRICLYVKYASAYHRLS